ncbi:unnamed protein product [Oppiella nova]|uniref:Legumain prodomain domain-containing protein n=1 Tax=Oppiella nova TaxID=334625 RepID=A0A7R9LQX5_9ACAR|nr:unnamed protein product [Oppiella nova]CAG2166075.1 unnamed protein product [Oppiella nova]
MNRISDVYHAYQLVHSQGIPDDRIIVMHSDDIAYDKHNPTPGVIINAINGTNVYEGVPKDYTGNDVTTKNFFGVLNGDPELIKHGKKEKIIMFPNETLHAKDLVNGLGELYKQNKYDQLVVYLESCKSGSMFANLLPNDWNLYALAATQPDEYGAQYFYDFSPRQTTYFATIWFQNAVQSDPKRETLDTQFQYIAARPDVWVPYQVGDETWCLNLTQHPQQYGDLSIAKTRTVSQFMGPLSQNGLNKDIKQDIILEKCNLTIDQDIYVFLGQKRIDLTVDTNEKQRYQDELDGLTRGREYVDKVLYEYVNSIQHLMPNIATNAILNTNRELYNRECYRKMVDTFHQKCFNLSKNTYALHKVHVFINICETLNGRTDDWEKAAKQLDIYLHGCPKPGREGYD